MANRVLWHRAGPRRFALEKLLACTEIGPLTVEHLLWRRATRLSFALRLQSQECSPKALHNIS